ncbi:MAG: aminoacyltransferase [Gemmatimonadota bacterium]|nr:aminoacyltransferase [Gemmatimonadota bacterium]
MQPSPEIQAPPAPPAPVRVIVTPRVSAPEAVYRAYNEQRKELRNQLDQLEGRRTDLQNQLSNDGVKTSLRAGLEARVADLDKRIADVDKQLATADQQVAQAASVPGAIVERPPEVRRGPPEEVFILSGMFIVIVFLPLSLAYARRIWKRGAAAVTSFPQELVDRLNRLDQSMDSIAIEVERIGEGQRFVTRVLTDNSRALGGGAAQPVDIGVRGEKARVGREGGA